MPLTMGIEKHLDAMNSSLARWPRSKDYRARQWIGHLARPRIVTCQSPLSRPGNSGACACSSQTRSLVVI